MSAPAAHGRLPAYAVVGLVSMIVFQGLLFTGNSFIGRYFTPIQWTGLILFLDGLHQRRAGRSWVSDHFREFLLLCAISIGKSPTYGTPSMTWLPVSGKVGWRTSLRGWRFISLRKNRRAIGVICAMNGVDAVDNGYTEACFPGCDILDGSDNTVPVVDTMGRIHGPEYRACFVFYDALPEFFHIEVSRRTIFNIAVNKNSDHNLGHLTDFLFDSHLCQELIDFSLVFCYNRYAFLR